MKITTGDLTRALLEDFPPATSGMVLQWCEEGLIETWINPIGTKHFLKPQSIKAFCIDQLRLDADAIVRVGSKLGLDFNLV